MKQPLLPDALMHGGDYNPEQWLDRPDILKKDIELLILAKINTVSVGIFSWSFLEPREGEFDLDWLARIIESLYRHGISVILSTPSGARPKWLADKYPEVLRVDAERRRQHYGLRHNHCYTSPVYRQKVRTINMQLARRFGEHPAVRLWHISNEYGGECHCPLCQEAFRDWLRARYHTIEELNSRWCTAFWSHTYQGFEQVESPSPLGEPLLNGLNLDWRRFVTDRTVDFARQEIAALREAGSNKPVTINMMYDHRPLNYHRFADLLDIVSWDNYPTWHKGPEHVTAADSAMQHDVMRSIKKQPFLLMESCPGATSWQSVSKLKRPGVLRAASLQAVAHGADSALYFQIRQSRGGIEKLHGAVIDHYGGQDTRVFEEVTATGAALGALAEVRGTQTAAQAAVVLDWESRWALEDSQGPRNKGLYYKETVQKAYAALRRLGLNVDVIDTEQPLDGYRLVIAPMLYLFRGDFTARVRTFVEQGGSFVLGYWSGVADENDRCFLGGRPHDLMDVMGLRATEIDALYDGEENRLNPAADNALGLKNTYRCERFCELVRLDGATPLLEYAEDFYAGTPAATAHSYGRGMAYYLCAEGEQRMYDDLAEAIVRNIGLALPSGAPLPTGIEVTERRSDTARYLFVQNFTRQPASLPFSPEGWDMLYGDFTNEGKARLIPFGTAVLKRPVV